MHLGHLEPCAERCGSERPLSEWTGRGWDTPKWLMILYRISIMSYGGLTGKTMNIIIDDGNRDATGIWSHCHMQQNIM